MDALVSVLLEKLIALVEKKVKIVTDFPDEFRILEENMKDIESFLVDVDKTKHDAAMVRRNINKLREVMYEAEDIMADYSFSSSRSVMGRLTIGKQLKDINQRIMNIKKTSHFLKAEGKSPRKNESATEESRVTVLDDAQIVGLEDTVKKIRGWIPGINDGRTFIGFVGMGGSGKTTLAEMVMKDKTIDTIFEKKMFVSVSRPVDKEKIMKSMLEQLGDISSYGDERRMLTKISGYLKEKSYFLVLDDVWGLENNWWTNIGSALPKVNGSCIVITSRMENIVREMGVEEDRIHGPEPLGDEDGWTLFSNIVFSGRRKEKYPIDKDLEGIGREIVRKCHGLPLAIKTVGGLVSSKKISPGEWSVISEKFTEELSNRADAVVASSLQLSYNELPYDLKPCFLCFSIFPEDCIVLRDQLTRWWIGEGFVKPKKDELLTESAENCFMRLVNRCLIEVVQRDYSGKVYTCKMHDLVRDMVINIGEKEEFCPVMKNGKREENKIYRHMPMNGSTTNQMSTSNTKLRAVVSVTNCRSVGNVTTAFLEKICGCQYLRVLDLSESMFETHFKDMLSKKNRLSHLTYLNLRNAHPMLEVPTEICNLRCLLVLDLSFCQSLKTLPSCITNLKKLTLLDVTCCGSLKYLPKGLGNISSLQVIKGFKPSRPCFTEGCRFEELRKLTQLVTLEMVVDRDDEISEGEFDALSNLDHLQHLTINCFNSYGTNLVQNLDRLVLPSKKLSEINLKYYPGLITPTWLNPTSLPKLRRLSLCSGDFTSFHQSFYEGKEQWWIEWLMLELLPHLDEDWNNVCKAMPYLRLLTASWCPELRNFPIENIDFEGGVWRSS